MHVLLYACILYKLHSEGNWKISFKRWMYHLSLILESGERECVGLVIRIRVISYNSLRHKYLKCHDYTFYITKKTGKMVRNKVRLVNVYWTKISLYNKNEFLISELHFLRCFLNAENLYATFSPRNSFKNRFN